MKKLTLTLIGILSLIGCSSDDNTTTLPIEPVNHLIGSWKLNTMSIYQYDGDELQQSQIDTPVSNFMTWEYTFKIDNTVEYTILAPIQGLNESGTATYLHNNNNLEITIENELQNMEITRLDNDNLHLKINQQDSTSTYIIEQKFVKK